MFNIADLHNPGADVCYNQQVLRDVTAGNYEQRRTRVCVHDLLLVACGKQVRLMNIPNTHAVLVDGSLLSHAVSNGVSNAAKYGRCFDTLVRSLHSDLLSSFLAAKLKRQRASLLSQLRKIVLRANLMRSWWLSSKTKKVIQMPTASFCLHATPATASNLVQSALYYHNNLRAQDMVPPLSIVVPCSWVEKAIWR